MVKILLFIFICSILIYHVIILDFEFQVLMSIVLRNQSAMFLICFLIGMICTMKNFFFFWHGVFYDNIICCFFKPFEGNAF
jgi:hypothetical protein